MGHGIYNMIDVKGRIMCVRYYRIERYPIFRVGNRSPNSSAQRLSRMDFVKPWMLLSSISLSQPAANDEHFGLKMLIS